MKRTNCPLKSQAWLETRPGTKKRKEKDKKDSRLRGMLDQSLQNLHNLTAINHKFSIFLESMQALSVFYLIRIKISQGKKIFIPTTEFISSSNAPIGTQGCLVSFLYQFISFYSSLLYIYLIQSKGNSRYGGKCLMIKGEDKWLWGGPSSWEGH